ncbi:hypothetical protein FB567DRAFT_626231 [Paraphoma chrysanthemicola]|uniref:AAA+ ATPase domain-containing protein n=1 Tax=Paraphoma chrysanthemicola TaxID=798071 RepID=A0A8K0RA11_9PLEO|nr:hypothetical protein FB567DRAFT_626231 [Paraphoma chrysanthemicola]
MSSTNYTDRGCSPSPSLREPLEVSGQHFSEHESSQSDDECGSSFAHDDESNVDLRSDPFACVDTPTHETGGEICELHVYENRYNARGFMVSLKIGAVDQLPVEDSPNPDAALVVFRFYDQRRALKNTVLKIQSPHMKKALQDVIRTYPGVCFDAVGSIDISGPDVPRCVFHYRQELQAYGEASDDESVREHVDFLLRYMARAMQKELASWQTLMDATERSPGLEFKDLWMAFKPGELLYTVENSNGYPQIVQLLLIEMVQGEQKDDKGCAELWRILAKVLYCDGTVFTYREWAEKIPKYDGYRSFVDLPIYPLTYHQDAVLIRQSLLRRGKRWLDVAAGPHQCDYAGSALMCKVDGATGIELFPADGRVIIDAKEYCRNIVYPKLLSGVKSVPVKDLTEKSFTDDEVLCCSHYVLGFSLVHKRWGGFSVQGLKDINFDISAFDSLVIQPDQKSFIRSLVNNHQNKRVGFDDLIKGKGKGLIFLLHGPPGVGKTLTAESLADYTQRPLYTLGCGELGTNSLTVSRTLTRSLNLASKWNALILVDEADVFMEQRHSHSLHRNELVSILLRALEYFEGIMFLTTNRVESIDTAFKSRIHLSLYYPKLSHEARSSIWKMFIARSSNTALPTLLEQRFLDRLASYDINGRQIKNIIRMACSIAANEQRDLEADDLMRGLQALTSFEHEFGASERYRTLNVAAVTGRLAQRLGVPMWTKATLVSSLTITSAQKVMGTMQAVSRWLRARRRRRSFEP